MKPKKDKILEPSLEVEKKQEENDQKNAYFFPDVVINGKTGITVYADSLEEAMKKVDTLII